MLETIFNHRSIRKFSDKPIEEEMLGQILEAGTRASTTGNMQAYSIIVTRDKQLKEKLWEAHFRQNMVLEAPVHITFCADFNRFGKWCIQRDADPGFDNFLSFFTAAIDALLVSQNVSLAAEVHGLGICYLGTVTYMADKIIDILDLPVSVVPVAAIVMGYPDEDPDLTDRLPVNGVVHNEKYTDYRSEDIDRIYAVKEASELTSKLLRENSKSTLAQIFTDSRYTRKDNVYFSGQFLKVLQKQGFMNNEMK